MASSSTDRDPSLDAGYTHVDAQPDTSPLVAGMEETSRWDAVRELRAWERERLRLVPGARIVDVGCGLGDALTALAPAVQPGGVAVGIDASEAMLEVARQRADAPGVSFMVGDALALDLDDGSFDACRSERMLQWVPDLEAAVAEMVRVLRPGGRLSLIDTDWRTFALDLPDVEAAQALVAAMEAFRGEASWAGGRLLNVCRRLGLADLDTRAAAHQWTSWDPDVDAGPPGLFPLDAISDQLVEAGVLDPDLARRFVADVEAAARQDRLHISVTMMAVSAGKP